jgi:hypothetical protein
MLLAAGVTKIHVCAPSNAAVDEILSRCSTKGLIGVSSDQKELKGALLRIGATEHDPAPQIRQHTLDIRLAEVLNDAR